VISGPSGAGKGTLISRVLACTDHLAVSVSATTRGRRAREREGREYYFVSPDAFLRMVEEGAFLEWAEYSGNLYGTPAEPVAAHLAAGRDVILEIELQGARQVLRRMPESLLVFIAPPSMQELENRLRGRETETEEDIARRLAVAREEMAELARDAGREVRDFDYAIVNDDVESAAAKLRAAIEEIRQNDPTR
jgi:guanylate kinase